MNETLSPEARYYQEEAARQAGQRDVDRMAAEVSDRYDARTAGAVQRPRILPPSEYDDYARRFEAGLPNIVAGDEVARDFLEGPDIITSTRAAYEHEMRRPSQRVRRLARRALQAVGVVGDWVHSKVWQSSEPESFLPPDRVVSTEEAAEHWVQWNEQHPVSEIKYTDITGRGHPIEGRPVYGSNGEIILIIK